MISLLWNFTRALIAFPISILSLIILPRRIWIIHGELSSSSPPPAKLRVTYIVFSRFTIIRHSSAKFLATKQCSARDPLPVAMLWVSSASFPLFSYWLRPVHFLQWHPPCLLPSGQKLGAAILLWNTFQTSHHHEPPKSFSAPLLSSSSEIAQSLRTMRTRPPLVLFIFPASCSPFKAPLTFLPSYSATTSSFPHSTTCCHNSARSAEQVSLLGGSSHWLFAWDNLLWEV